MGDGEFQLYVIGDTLYFQTLNGSTVVGQVTASITEATWTMVTVVQDVINNRVGIAINNGPFTYATLTGTSSSNTQNLTLGAFSDQINFLDGYFTSVGFWNVALTSRTSKYSL